MKNKFHSFNQNPLCKGCRLCVQGKKTVVLITGLCPRSCFFCPLSDQKYKKDVMYANERPCKDLKEITDEIKISKSNGAGITGGDPLLVLDRTIKLIKELKKDKNFHIHLYTSLNLVTKENMKRLYDSGLDEIRFHPDFNDSKLWDRIKYANLPWKKGVEIPIIPSYENKTKKLIKFISPHIDFLNLNELEMSDTNSNKLLEKNYKCKTNLSYAIKGSEELALKLLKWMKLSFPKLKVHYCTAKLKDAVQLANRLKIRAKSVKKRLDIIDEEGLLVRGVIFTNKEQMNKIIKEFGIPKQLIEWDKDRKQVLIASWVLLDIYKELKEKSAIVTEYPTYDRLIIEVNNL